MRISFQGKGGSGKTTIAAAFAKYCAKRQFVLAIDADVNVNMKEMLSLIGDETKLGENFDRIAEYVKGSRSDLKDMKLICTTPPSLNSKFIIPAQDDVFIEKYGVHGKNLSLLSVGTFEKENIGHSCYHGMLNSVELLFHHLLDSEKDIVVTDSATGVDSFGTSLYFAYDLIIFVVEPTSKSIGVYKDFKKLAEKSGIKVYVLANKIQEPEDLTFIKNNSENIIAVIPDSRNISLSDRGQKEYFDWFVDEISPELEKIRELLVSQKKNWKKYYSMLLENHKLRSLGWYDDFYSQKISDQIDSDFGYEKALERLEK